MAALLCSGPVVGHPQLGYFLTIAVALVGVLFWLVFVKFEARIPGTGEVLLDEIYSSEVNFTINITFEIADSPFL